MYDIYTRHLLIIMVQSNQVLYLLAIPVFYSDVLALLQFFAIFIPLVGGLGIPCRSLTFQRNLFPNMNIWAFQFLQFWRNSCEERHQTICENLPL